MPGQLLRNSATYDGGPFQHVVERWCLRGGLDADDQRREEPPPRRSVAAFDTG